MSLRDPAPDRADDPADVPATAIPVAAAQPGTNTKDRRLIDGKGRADVELVRRREQGSLLPRHPPDDDANHALQRSQSHNSTPLRRAPAGDATASDAASSGAVYEAMRGPVNGPTGGGGSTDDPTIAFTNTDTTTHTPSPQTSSSVSHPSSPPRIQKRPHSHSHSHSHAHSHSHLHPHLHAHSHALHLPSPARHLGRPRSHTTSTVSPSAATSLSLASPSTASPNHASRPRNSWRLSLSSSPSHANERHEQPGHLNRSSHLGHARGHSMGHTPAHSPLLSAPNNNTMDSSSPGLSGESGSKTGFLSPNNGTTQAPPLSRSATPTSSLYSVHTMAPASVGNAAPPPTTTIPSHTGPTPSSANATVNTPTQPPTLQTPTLTQKHLQETVTSLHEESLSMAHDLDTTYDSLYAKTHHLHASIRQLHDFFHLLRHADADLLRQGQALAQETRDQLAHVRSSRLEAHQSRIVQLRDHIRHGRAQVAQLTDRLDAVRERVEGWEAADQVWQERTRKRLRLTWMLISAVAVLAILGQWLWPDYRPNDDGDHIAVGTNGHANVSHGHVDFFFRRAHDGSRLYEGDIDTLLAGEPSFVHASRTQAASSSRRQKRRESPEEALHLLDEL